jgi:hypothetical protein
MAAWFSSPTASVSSSFDDNNIADGSAKGGQIRRRSVDGQKGSTHLSKPARAAAPGPGNPGRCNRIVSYQGALLHPDGCRRVQR